jgi:tRNA dimethylallyltransferase
LAALPKIDSESPIMTQQSIILIGGPTASGKSAFAMKVARETKGTIINADAMQVYKGLPLLTAQPNARDRAEIPHLLYEVMDAGESSSAGKWLVEAHKAIAQTFGEGRTPILVGGTGMYFSALLGGLADIPAIPESIRNSAESLYAKEGEAKFRALLALRDPESATRIARNDRQRLIRAYEVVIHTGKALGEWQKRQTDKGLSPHLQPLVSHVHVLMPSREELYAACDARFLKMIENGAIEEVKKLAARNLSPSLSSMKILGVRELSAYLKGQASLEDAIKKAQQMTRNYAKRQVTWFRNQWKKLT